MHRILAVYPRAVRLAVVLLTALVLAGCGAFGDGRNADVERGVATAVQDVLSSDAPFVELRSVTCTGGRPTLACRVDLGVGNEVVQVDYAVALAGDGCWTADARSMVVLGAGSQTNPLEQLSGASDLKGCLS
jgi:hypothetical protein